MDLDILCDRLKNLNTRYIQKAQERDTLESALNSFIDKKANLEKINEIYDKVTVVLTMAAQESRKNAKTHFEKIITDALQFVTQNSDYSFIIEEMTGRVKASYEFYVKSTVNGVECKQKPEDANGGGFVDIIASAAKYAYLEIFNDPKIMSGTLLYDEPGKMISADMSVKYAEYLKFLGRHYHKQTIMITHNEALSNVADKTFIVIKNQNGISTVKEPTTICSIEFDDMGIEEILNKNGNQD